MPLKVEINMCLKFIGLKELFCLRILFFIFLLIAEFLSSCVSVLDFICVGVVNMPKCAGKYRLCSEGSVVLSWCEEDISFGEGLGVSCGSCRLQLGSDCSQELYPYLPESLTSQASRSPKAKCQWRARCRLPALESFAWLIMFICSCFFESDQSLESWLPLLPFHPPCLTS